MSKRKRFRLMALFLPAGITILSTCLVYYIAISQLAKTSFNRPSIARLPVAPSHEAVVFEFYDESKSEQMLVKKEMDKIANELQTYDGRLKISSLDSDFKALKNEFGITELPAVVITNRKRDFKMVYTGLDLPYRLRAAFRSTGYEQHAKSNFG